MFNLTADFDAMVEDAMAMFVACSVIIFNAREKAFQIACDRAERMGEDLPHYYRRKGPWA